MMEEKEELELYGDTGIESGNARISGWLKFLYISLPIWGIIWMFLYWNGVHGWLDRGSWAQLEKAANTTYPHFRDSDERLPEGKN